jgi:hypothetical protein
MVRIQGMWISEDAFAQVRSLAKKNYGQLKKYSIRVNSFNRIRNSIECSICTLPNANPSVPSHLVGLTLTREQAIGFLVEAGRVL